MISFGLWIAGLLGKSVSQKTAGRIGLWVALPIALLALGLLGWAGKALYDRGIVKEAMDKRDADNAIGARKADQKADEEQLKRTAEIVAENERLEKAMAEAKRTDPAKGQTEVGPVQQSYFDNLPKKGKTP